MWKKSGIFKKILNTELANPNTKITGNKNKRELNTKKSEERTIFNKGTSNKNLNIRKNTVIYAILTKYHETCLIKERTKLVFSKEHR